jgi:hypothetical protein
MSMSKRSPSPLDPRVAPVLAVVPARVGLEQQVLALPGHEVGGDRAADPLHLPSSARAIPL